MSERYTKLYALPQNLYLEGAPILIVAGALLKDNTTGKILAQLKLRNLYKSPLTACKVHIRAFEPSGAELKGVDEYSYLDIHVKRGTDFGSQEPVYLSDNTTRQISVSVIQAVFEDGTVWQSPAAEWTQPPFKQQRIKDRFSDNEIQKQYSVEVGGRCEYIPETTEGLFLCTCGAINFETDKVCSYCCREIKKIIDALDESVLTSKMKERVAKEAAERKEQERIAEEKRLEKERLEMLIQAEKEKQKKRGIKIIKIAAPILCAVIAFVIILNTVIIPNGKYNDAIALSEQGKSAQAARLFYSLGNYKDSRQQSQSLWNKIASSETISAGGGHTVGIKSDGTVIATEVDSNMAYGQCDISGWRNIIAISAGFLHTVGLKSNGTVAATGPFYKYNMGQCDVDDWNDIIAISAGGLHTVGLKSDCTVVTTGLNDDGQCDVSDWTDIIAVSAGLFHTVGLKSDNTVVAVGDNSDGRCDVSVWTNITAISAGSHHTIGLKSDGTVVAVGDNNGGQCDVDDWEDIVAVSAGGGHTVGLKSDGTVVAVGDNNSGQCNVSGWSDIVAVSAGTDHTAALKSDGTVVAVGKMGVVTNDAQSKVSYWTDIKIPER